MIKPAVPPFDVKRTGEYATSLAVVSSVGPTAKWTFTLPGGTEPVRHRDVEPGREGGERRGGNSASASAEAPPMMASRVSFLIFLPLVMGENLARGGCQRVETSGPIVRQTPFV